MPNGKLIAPRGRSLKGLVGEEGILSDLIDLLGLEEPDPSDLITPLGAITKRGAQRLLKQRELFGLTEIPTSKQVQDALEFIDLPTVRKEMLEGQETLRSLGFDPEPVDVTLSRISESLQDIFKAQLKEDPEELIESLKRARFRDPFTGEPTEQALRKRQFTDPLNPRKIDPKNPFRDLPPQKLEETILDPEAVSPLQKLFDLLEGFAGLT